MIRINKKYLKKDKPGPPQCFTEQQKREIKQSGLSVKALAKQYGVCDRTIYRVLQNRLKG